MESIVCVKRVPATDSRITVTGDGIARDGLTWVLNPYDEFAVEAALALRESAGEGSVTVLSLGDEAAQKEVRTALAMGADQAVLLKDDSYTERDALTTARALASAIEGKPFDLLFFGKLAVDQDQHGVGAMVATLLGVPCISAVTKLEVDGGKVRAEREIEGAVEVVEAPLPCAITCDKGLNEPRYASLKGIMMAKKKPLDVIEATLEAASVAVDAMASPPERPAGRIVGEGPEAAAEVARLLKEEAGVL